MALAEGGPDLPGVELDGIDVGRMLEPADEQNMLPSRSRGHLIARIMDIAEHLDTCAGNSFASNFPCLDIADNQASRRARPRC